MSDRTEPKRPEHSYPLQGLTGRIIAAFHYVHRSLGYGLTESVYRRALAVELQYRGMAVAQEVRFEVTHRGVVVGVYRGDLVVESSVLVETKTGLVLDPVTPGQTLSYLRASQLAIGLILHFGPRPSVRRMILSEAIALAGRPNATVPVVRPSRHDNCDAEDAETVNADIETANAKT